MNQFKIRILNNLFISFCFIAHIVNNIIHFTIHGEASALLAMLVLTDVYMFSYFLIRVYQITQLEKRSIEDPLTKIYTRNYFFEFLSRQINISRRKNGSLSAVFFDIDNFKTINDTHGHTCGDTVLKEVTKIISRTIRDYDCFARLGGEEFGIIFPDTALPESSDVSERIRSEVENHVFPNKCHVTISIGLLEWNDEEVDEVYDKIDRAMFYSKTTGKNKITVWEDEIFNDID